jgi:glutaconate CoA-transferase subunit B
MRPDPTTKELVVTALHPGVTREQVAENTGWPVRFADPLEETASPTAEELSTLRDLQRRTTEAHARGSNRGQTPKGSDPLARRDLTPGSAA